MSWWREQKYLKDRAIKIFGLERISKINGPMVFAGIQAAGGAALAYYLYNDSEYRTLPCLCSAVAVIGTYKFFGIIRKENQKAQGSRNRQSIKHQSAWNLATGIFTYFTNVYAFSECLKHNDKMWIPSLAIAACGYYFSVAFVDSLEQAILEMKPGFKCCQFLFGPTLIGSAAFYLLILQKHNEEWLRWLLMVASTAVAINMSKNSHLTVRRHMGRRGLLFYGLELLVSGCMMYINGTVLSVYAINKNFHPLLTLCFSAVIYLGVNDFSTALVCFQRYLLIDEQVFVCISGMIFGPIIFFSACICFKFVKRIIMLPGFLFISGTGLAMLGNGVLTLHDLVTPPVFIRYCRRLLGPVVIAYGTFTSAYIGYRMGWRYSVVLMPLIPFGINATYRGWRV